MYIRMNIKIKLCINEKGKCTQKVLLVIYSIPETFLKAGPPRVVNLYSMSKSNMNEPHAKQISSKEKEQQSRKKGS